MNTNQTTYLHNNINKSFITQSLLRLGALLFLLPWAGGGGSSNYYASLKISEANGKPTGAGSVYVANSNSKPGTANPNTAVKSSATTTSGGNVTMFYWIDVNPGYNVSSTGKVDFDLLSEASTSGNVTCAASTTADGTQAYTATATFVAVTVDNPSPAAVNLEPTDPSTDYPFTVTFPTSNLKTIAIDLNKSPETATVGKFKDIAWSLDGSNVKVTGKFNGGGTYGGASRNNSTTVSLQSKAADSPTRTCVLTANVPTLEFVSVETTEVYSTQGESGKTGSATFTYNYGAEDDFPTTPTLTHTSGSGSFSVTGYTVAPNFSTGVTTVTVNYEFNTNNGVGETVEQLKLTAANGDVQMVTISGHSEALATDDAKVTKANGDLVYQGDWATALSNQADGYTLTLLRNVDLETLTAKQSITTNLTLDLNGKTLSGTVSSAVTPLLYMNAANKTLTIKDSKTGGKISATGTYTNALYGVYINNGSVILNSGTIEIENTNTSQTTADRWYATGVYVKEGKVDGEGLCSY